MRYLLFSILCCAPCYSVAEELRFLCETKFYQEFKLSEEEQHLLPSGDERFILTVEGDQILRTDWGDNKPHVYENCLIVGDVDYRCPKYDMSIIFKFDTSTMRFLMSSTRGYYNEILADNNPWMIAGDCTKF